MKIRNEVHYALRIVYYLTKYNDKEIISSGEISEKEGISRIFCLRIIKKLEKAGIVKIYRGIKGGYTLARDPKRITFRDIVEVIDEEIILERYINSETICGLTNDCSIKRSLVSIQTHLLNELDQINFYDLVKKNA